MNWLKEFWSNHQHKVYSVLAGILGTLLLIGSNSLCGKLPPVFAQICVTSVSALSDTAKLEAARQRQISDGNGGAHGTPDADLSKPLCDEAHCASTGFAFPLEDGGSCRCVVKP